MTTEAGRYGLDRFRLDGRVALITGGSKGLGEAMGAALASAGADLMLVSRHAEEARATAARIAAAGTGVVDDARGRPRGAPRAWAST